MKKLFAISILLMTIILSSCSSEAVQTVRLTFWTTTNEENTVFFQERLDAFQAEHPNVKVDLVQVSFTSASNQFKSAILGDQNVDVFLSDNSWISEYADLGILYPLDSLASDEQLAGYVPTAIEADKYQGKLYGLPSVLESPALLYNKRILEKYGYSGPPSTMDELMKVARSVTDGTHYGIFVSEDSYLSMPYIWAFGGGTIADNRKVEIASDDSRKALEFMLQLIDEGVAQPYSDYADSYNRTVDDFKSGRSAMAIAGPWMVSAILAGSEFTDSSNLGIAPIPEGPKGQGSPIGGHSLVISKYSEHVKEAYELISFLTSEETQLLQSKKFKSLPSQNAVYEDVALMNDSVIQGFKEQLVIAKPRPLVPEGAQMFNDFTPNLRDILIKELTVEQGVKNIEAAWNRLLRNK